jgi:hypothetical protein
MSVLGEIDSFREMSDGTVILTDGSTLLVRVGMVRFQMCNDMIRTVSMFDMYLVYGGVLCHLVSWFHVCMNVLRGDMAMICGTRCGVYLTCLV